MTYFDKTNGTWGGRCACGWAPKDLNHRSKSAVELEYTGHLQNVQRARTGLNRGAGTLKSQRDYYLQMASDKAIEPGQRRLWRLLADELTTRLNDQGDTEDGQLSLL